MPTEPEKRAIRAIAKHYGGDTEKAQRIYWGHKANLKKQREAKEKSNG